MNMSDTPSLSDGLAQLLNEMIDYERLHPRTPEQQRHAQEILQELGLRYALDDPQS